MPKVGDFETISGDELRRRIDRLGLTNAEAARRLGLTESGLYKAMSGVRRVGRQTEIILGHLEEWQRLRESRRQGELPLGDKVMRRRRERDLAQHLYPTNRRTRSS